MSQYQYRCSGGHEVESKVPVSRCPACVRGERCTGELVRVGAGSRGPRRPVKLPVFDGLVNEVFGK